jgi:hypothetical protein
MAEARVSTVFTPTTWAILENVASSITSVMLFDYNPDAHGRAVYNDSTSIAFLKFGEGASSTSHTMQLAPGMYYEFPQPFFCGRVDAIWVTANGAARVTEW